jgi:hypothetical protein
MWIKSTILGALALILVTSTLPGVGGPYGKTTFDEVILNFI